MSYFFLAIAIVLEVLATNALKATDGFTRLAPSVLVVIGYSGAFYFLALALKTIPVGAAYAIWAGVGIALVALVAAVVFRQMPDLPTLLGMGLIIAGVVLIGFFSKTAGH